MALVKDKEVANIVFRKYLKNFAPLLHCIDALVIITEKHSYLVKAIDDDKDVNLDDFEKVNISQFSSHYLYAINLGTGDVKHFINEEFYKGKKYILDLTDDTYKYSFCGISA